MSFPPLAAPSGQPHQKWNQPALLIRTHNLSSPYIESPAGGILSLSVEPAYASSKAERAWRPEIFFLDIRLDFFPY